MDNSIVQLLYLCGCAITVRTSPVLDGYPRTNPIFTTCTVAAVELVERWITTTTSNYATFGNRLLWPPLLQFSMATINILKILGFLPIFTSVFLFFYSCVTLRLGLSLQPKTQFYSKLITLLFLGYNLFPIHDDLPLDPDFWQKCHIPPKIQYWKKGLNYVFCSVNLIWMTVDHIHCHNCKSLHFLLWQFVMNPPFL